MSSEIVQVVRLTEFLPIAGKDRIVIAKARGWNVIVAKEQYAHGDLAIYVPQDYVIPPDIFALYELNHKWFKHVEGGWKVGFLKLAKVLSQGLLLNVGPILDRLGTITEDENVAERLGIHKWEPPVPEYQRQAGVKNPQITKLRPNPNFEQYDGPEHLKNFFNSETGEYTIFSTDEDVIVTEKIHGTNFRAGYVTRIEPKGFWSKLIYKFLKRFIGEREFAVGSRRVHLVGDNPSFYPGDVYWKMANRMGLKNILMQASRDFNADVTLYGEIYGSPIQDLTYGLTNGKQEVAFFDIKVGDSYLCAEDFSYFCGLYSLPTVPVLYVGAWHDRLPEIHTSGKSMLCDTQIREGCVIKPLQETNTVEIGRKILKSISPDYITRGSEETRTESQ